ncbi:MAG: citrate transporter, partial [Burkholderiaceae bacterium]
MAFDPAGIPLEFILFAAVLAGVALLHHHTMRVALVGLAMIALYKLAFTGFAEGPGLSGLAHHLVHESVTIANLFCLLLGFALLARHFEESGIPASLPQYLPDGRAGAFVLLCLVFVISSFLDNIAAAIIGGSVAAVVIRGRVHIGYLAGIVAASNAGGSGSVVGDTTTTMIWIAGASPLSVLHAYVGAVIALGVVGWVASGQQHAHAPLQRDGVTAQRIDWARA